MIDRSRRIDQMRSDFIANAWRIAHAPRFPDRISETMRGPAKDDVEVRMRFVDVMLDRAERMSPD